MNAISSALSLALDANEDSFQSIIRDIFIGAVSGAAIVTFGVILKARRAQPKLNINQVKVVKKFINPCKIDVINQSFALPKPLMDHLTQQPSSPKAWIKLIQTCKHFFGSNPIVVVAGFEWASNNSWLISNLNNKKLKLQIVDFESYKLWLMGALEAYDNDDPQELNVFNSPITKVVSDLVPHIYKSGLRKLCIDHQKLSYEEFQFLTQEKKIWGLQIIESAITYADGNMVPLEVILGALPVIEVLYLDNTYKFITPETFKNLLMLPKLKNFKTIDLKGLENSLDLEGFVQFLKSQKLQRIELYLTDFVPPLYIKTFVAAMKEFTEDEENQQFINFLEVYHEDFLIFQYCMDVMF